MLEHETSCRHSHYPMTSVICEGSINIYRLRQAAVAIEVVPEPGKHIENNEKVSSTPGFHHQPLADHHQPKTRGCGTPFGAFWPEIW